MTKREFTFSLIICTYERPASLKRLLESVEKQSLYPDEILIVDGSGENDTRDLFDAHNYKNLRYIKVEKEDSGLTRQRNYGIGQSGDVDIICFLDDDIVLEREYFAELITTYKKRPEAIAAGGWINDETVWQKVEEDYKPAFDEFKIDGYIRKLGQRNVLRKRLGLLSDKPPGFMPEFSHGFSTGFLPPSGKIYEVEFFMGGVASYRKSLFSEIEFSSYFEGYGLYEDMDFCLRASKLGKLYVNTAARVFHLHEESGRPDHYKYGQMVVKNGKYVWKNKNPKPKLKARVKWYGISYLLAFIRLFNYLEGDKSGFADFKGRISALLN
ncbi:glycosyl transferase family 2 [Christiangramia fulva]|uniref:Glycosyl transferase family 2 n=1 Tax=Christiangramia fulva TaxID=2126553 RepID=A0A2R3ZAB6_9FLAO|nr:glycosyltransferase family 2 protein [Christiangramia fulva]AVR47263.1 glycosyl transferase family 2 [Christiangramia fulva]